MKTQKPKYWVVINDGSQLFKDTVIKKMNEINVGDDPWHGDICRYYGYNGQDIYDGIFTSNILCGLKNNPTLLTLFDFVDLFMKDDKKIKAGDTVYVRDSDTDIWETGTYIATLDRRDEGCYIVEVENIPYVHWNQMKKIDDIPEYTMKELIEIVGHEFKYKKDKNEN